MTVQMPRTAPISRHVPLTALFNVRDLGGYQARAGQSLRWQRIYRADSVARATSQDLSTLAERGIRTIIDLRTDREVLRWPSPTVLGATTYIEQHHLPLLRATWDEVGYPVRDGDTAADFLAARYVEMMIEGAPAIANALRIMARPSSHPVLFHCSLGKDRTGVLAAVLLALLGVHPETIAEDYASSALGVTAFLAWVEASGSPLREDVRGTPPAHLACPPEAIERVLARVRDRCRSMVGYARSIGVDFETIEALHLHLLD